MLELDREGRAPRAYRARPAVPAEAAWLWRAYWELDRTEHGSIPFSAMRELLDEYGIRALGRRQELRLLWRRMNAAEMDERSKRVPGADRPSEG